MTYCRQQAIERYNTPRPRRSHGQTLAYEWFGALNLQLASAASVQFERIVRLSPMSGPNSTRLDTQFPFQRFTMAEKQSSALKAVAPKLFAVLGAACLIIGCWPRYSKTEQNGTYSTRFSIGLPSSPWILFVRETTAEQSGAVNFTSSFNQSVGLELISWSMLLLVAAQVLFSGASWIRKRGPPRATPPNTK